MAARVNERPDKRAQILAAAGPIFGELGYERASVDAIAVAAKVSKPTVYNYFGNKEQLFRESLADSAEQLNSGAHEAIRALQVNAADWPKGLHDLGWALAECQRSDCARFTQRLIASESGRDPDLQNWIWQRSGAPILDALAGRLAMLANAGRLTLPDPDLAARQFFALISAELPELTQTGRRPASQARLRTAVTNGVDTFLAAYATASPAITRSSPSSPRKSRVRAH